MNCFAVVAGKNATADGSVILAHNEDDGGEQMLNIYNVPKDEATGRNKYLWIEFPGMEVADGFLNEYGVAVVSDACKSREDRMDVTDGGILYELRTLAAQKARSSRHAVELMGKLIEEKGYNGSGRSYMLADSKEAWILSVVQGRHWVAQRIPDDKVMIIPNNYVISGINLADTTNFKGSADIITYAVERGWYNPAEGIFSFKKAYSAPATYISNRNVTRHMSALKYVTGDNYSDNPDTYPFAVTPNRKITIEDMIEILSSHGENIDKKSVFKNKQEHQGCICVDNTVNASVFHLRNWLPVEIGAMVWTTGGRPCCEAFIPWYSGMTRSPEGFERFATAEEAIARHFSDAEQMRKNYPNAIAWKFESFWEWVTEDYDGRIGEVKERKEKIQQKLFQQSACFEESLKSCYNPNTLHITDSLKLQKKLNKHTADLYRQYFKKHYTK